MTNFVVRSLVFISKLIITSISSIFSPFFYLGSNLLTLPIRTIARFETILIWLTIAATLGLFVGCLLHFASRTLASLYEHKFSGKLVLKRPKASLSSISRGKNLERRWRTAYFKGNDGRGREFWNSFHEIKALHDHCLLEQTIMEEEDSDF
ncbi:hypothetical protein OnM2_073040 [Erysiphe neolycopersici]|uniref:Uncharacterized protein n=1 Tax=Erysiphe neolycopersici TaxID=212602 RepID=A0A420HJK9_9PEZI|nr:hypothetical protein OnM2_073040 [Erysiphe neolycopersici]